MNTHPIQTIGAQADKAARARTPSVVYPSHGGINNPDWKFRRGSDIANTRYTAVGDTQVSRTKVVAIVDRVVAVERFGGK